MALWTWSINPSLSGCPVPDRPGLSRFNFANHHETSSFTCPLSVQKRYSQRQRTGPKTSIRQSINPIIPTPQNPQYLKAHQATNLTVVTHVTHVTVQPGAHAAFRIRVARPAPQDLLLAGFVSGVTLMFVAWFTGENADRHLFSLAVVVYGLSVFYSVFLWRKGFRVKAGICPI